MLSSPLRNDYPKNRHLSGTPISATGIIIRTNEAPIILADVLVVLGAIGLAGFPAWFFSGRRAGACGSDELDVATGQGTSAASGNGDLS